MLTDSIQKVARSLAFLSVDRPEGLRCGTAFVVSGRDLVTAAHLLRDARKIEATVVGQKGATVCTIVETDIQSDVALLRAEARDLQPVSLHRGPTTIAIGREVAFLGFPHADIFQPPMCMAMRGIVGNRHSLGTIDYYVIDAGASEGMSGGPLFLAQTGEVIGVIGGRFDPGRTRAKLRGVSPESLRDLPAERTNIVFATCVEYVLALMKRRA